MPRRAKQILRIVRKRARNTQRDYIRIGQIIGRFKGEQDDITSYLRAFESQCRQLKICEEDWVVNLIGLLPHKVNTWLTLDEQEEALDYAELKLKLLELYRFDAEKFRQLFRKHSKNGATWSIFARELLNNAREWVAGLKINTFEGLLNLIVADQMKHKVPGDMREHFVDRWAEFSNPLEFAKILDAYENARQGWKKPQLPSFRPERTFRKEHGNNRAPVAPHVAPKPAGSTNGVEKHSAKKEFEAPYVRKCYECQSTTHLIKNCPRKKGNQINHVCEPEAREFLRQHIVAETVNEQPTEILRNTGASFDLVSANLVTDRDYTGEPVWIKQPLHSAAINLPVAEIRLNSELGSVITRAAIVPKENQLNYYLLSNRTYQLLLDIKQGLVEEQTVNMVTTRSKEAAESRTKAKDAGDQQVKLPEAEGDPTAKPGEGEHEPSEGFPEICLLADGEELELAVPIAEILKVNTERFSAAQKGDEGVNTLFEKYKDGKAE